MIIIFMWNRKLCTLSIICVCIEAGSCPAAVQHKTDHILQLYLATIIVKRDGQHPSCESKSQLSLLPSVVLLWHKRVLLRKETFEQKEVFCILLIYTAVNVNALNPTCNGTASDWFFFSCRQVPFSTGIWRSAARDCKIFRLKRCFHYAQVQFNSGFTVLPSYGMCMLVVWWRGNV